MGERSELKEPKRDNPTVLLLAEVECLKQQMDKMHKGPAPPVPIVLKLKSPLVELLL